MKVVKINRRKREKRNREGKSKVYIQSDKRQQNTGFTLMSADCRRENAATQSVLGVSGELEPGLETDKVPGPWLCPAPRSAFQAHYDNVRDLSRLGSLFPASPLLI